MGFWSTLGLAQMPAVDASVRVTAATMPDPFGPALQNAWSPYAAGWQYVTRQEAMTVPAISRARSIICSTIGTMPIETYRSIDDVEIPNRKFIDQPDPAVPREVTYTYLIDDLFFHGVAYMQILDISPEDGRPYAARRIDPIRVSPITNQNGTLITGYQVDTMRVPNSGLGSLIVIHGLDEGLLARGGRSVRTMIELENAALHMAQEPAPAIHLNNKGMNLDSATKLDLLAAFRKARQGSSVAYTEGDIELNMLSFDAAQLQLVEARQFAAQEAARLTNIPAWYLNAESASATYSNVSQERRSLIDLGVRMYMHPLEARFSMDDITPRGNYVRFDLDDFLRGNATERVDVTVKLFQAGIITLDEARYMEDLAPSAPVTQTEGM